MQGQTPDVSSGAIRDAGRRSRRASCVLDHSPKGLWELLGRNSGLAMVSVNVPEILLMEAVPNRSFNADNKSQLWLVYLIQERSILERDQKS